MKREFNRFDAVGRLPAIFLLFGVISSGLAVPTAVKVPIPWWIQTL